SPGECNVGIASVHNLTGEAVPKQHHHGNDAVAEEDKHECAEEFCEKLGYQSLFHGRGHFITLWRNRDFLKLWSGQPITEVGSRITREGLPLTAALVLHATPAQMGYLAAFGRALRPDLRTNRRRLGGSSAPQAHP